MHQEHAVEVSGRKAQAEGRDRSRALDDGEIVLGESHHQHAFTGLESVDVCHHLVVAGRPLGL